MPASRTRRATRATAEAAKAKAAAEAARAAEVAAEAARTTKAAAKSTADKSTAAEAEAKRVKAKIIEDAIENGTCVFNPNTGKLGTKESIVWDGKQVEEPVEKTVQKPVRVISKKPEPLKEFAEYPDGVVPGLSIPLMYILGFLAVVFRNGEMSVGDFIDSITEMVGFPVEVYSLGKGNIYIICFKSSIKDLFAAVNASYRARHKSKIAIRTYQSDRFREGTRCFPLFHPEDPIFQENKRKMKTIPEEVEASSNSFAALPF
jgi:hypothetical protein